MKLEFSRQFRKILRHQIPCKSVQWEPSCSMRTDRQIFRSWQLLSAVLRTRQTKRYQFAGWSWQRIRK